MLYVHIVIFILTVITSVRSEKFKREARNASLPRVNTHRQNIIPRFSCDFDRDYCRWLNDTTGDFQWLRNTNNTDSDETGPPWDHTTQDTNRQGYYLYIESSDHRNRAGNRARIISPVLNSPGPKCLSLWHHMHGEKIQDLNIYLKSVDKRRMTLIDRVTGAWSIEKHRGFRAFRQNEPWWNEQTFEFYNDGRVQIVIEAMKGDDYRGDIAIDDITLRRGFCPSRSPDCDFELNMCGWIQLSNDDFNWLPNIGKTHSFPTGPTVDHTFGTPDGRYLYIEASWPRLKGDKARILSPAIRCLPNATPLFRFWYHMKGRLIGFLRLYVVPNASASPGMPLWQREGEQADEWIEGVVSISSRWQKFHILIEGETNDYLGDIAIDDVSLSNCHILSPQNNSNLHSPNATKTTTAIPSTTTPNPEYNLVVDPNRISDDLSCAFSNGSFCQWRNVQNGDFTWTLNQGQTESFGTGPLHGYPDSTGWYAYAEASSPRELGDKALLRSPTVSSTIHICLQFHYHMYGRTMGSLEVMTFSAGSATLNRKWVVMGEQSRNEREWQFAQVDISEEQNYDILFQAVRGDNFYSDIAIDDIKAFPTSCATLQNSSISNEGLPPITATNDTENTDQADERISCNFDQSTFCNWWQDPQSDFDFFISNSSGTPSPRTGPNTDHTGGGEFAYIEASVPRILGDSARLVSTTFNSTSPSCFSLWYHMLGSEIGNLSISQLYVDILANGSRVMRNVQLWMESGNKGYHWNIVQLNLISSYANRIIVEATVGPGWKGDIAIDDLQLINKECPIFNCTFQTGICGWTQDQGDNFDWTRWRLQTPSNNTGPYNDHTYKNENGYYLYIETSKPRIRGQVARLISPIVPSSENNSSKCIQFWYHSKGPHIGRLSVYKRDVNDDSPPLESSPIWYVAQDEDDGWIFSKITVEDISPFQIIIEGTRGYGGLGDLAIDDISISEGHCVICCNNQNFFQCGNNFCVPSSVKCNGVDDCEDGSDEAFCGVCGRPAVYPLTSSLYGTVRNDIPDSFPSVDPFVLGRSRFRNSGRIARIDPSTLPFVRNAHVILAGENDIGINTSEYSLIFQNIAAGRNPEVIRFHTKRSIASLYYLDRETNHSLSESTMSSDISHTNVDAELTSFSKQTSSPINKFPKEAKMRKNIPSIYKSKELKSSLQYKHRMSSKKTSHSLLNYLKTFKPMISRNKWKIINSNLVLLPGNEKDEDEENNNDINATRKRIRKSANVQLRIVGGDRAIPHTWPWHGAYVITDTFAAETSLCGATLISPYWAVTAAHCAFLGNRHDISFGDHNLMVTEDSQQAIKVDTIFIHPGFNPSERLDNDIALIKLKFPVRITDAVQPACLLSPDQPDFPPGYVCAITGWGRVRHDTRLIAAYLRQAEVPLLSQETCQKIYSNVILDSMFCAGGLGTNTCEGDSGGPLICSRNNTAYLVGTTSWGDPTCPRNVPGVYTRIKSYYRWMREVMQNTDTCNQLI